MLCRILSNAFYLSIRENSLTIYEGIIQKKVNKAEV